SCVSKNTILATLDLLENSATRFCTVTSALVRVVSAVVWWLDPLFRVLKIGGFCDERCEDLCFGQLLSLKSTHRSGQCIVIPANRWGKTHASTSLAKLKYTLTWG